MKKWLALFLIFAVQSAYCEEDGTVLRRVFFAVGSGAWSSVPGIQAYLPDMLYSLITSIQPIIRVKNPVDAHSQVLANLESIGKARSRVDLILKDDGNETDRYSWEFDPATYTQDELKTFLDVAASRFASRLGRVKPKTEIVDAVRDDEEAARSLAEVSFAKEMALPIELTIWSGYAGKAVDRVNDGEIGLHLQFPLPLVAECAFFWDANQSLLVSLYFDYNDYMFFGYSSSEPALSNNYFILPGIGYEFRTTGVVTAGFAASTFTGVVIVHALEDVVSGMLLPAGQTAVNIFNYINMKLVLGFNPTKELGFKTNIGVFFPLTYVVRAVNPGFNPGYSMEGSWMLMQFFSIGISYRL